MNDRKSANPTKTSWEQRKQTTSSSNTINNINPKDNKGRAETPNFFPRN